MIQPINIQLFKQLMKAPDVLLIDTRTKDVFVEGFIPGAIFMGLGKHFEEYAKKVIPFRKKLLIIASEGKDEEACNHLYQLGYDVEGYLEGGMNTWVNSGEQIDMIVNIDADELAMDIPFDKKMVVLDVRSPEEYEKEHVKNAVNIPVDQLTDPAMVGNFEDDDNIYLHCAGGYRSLIAASLLKKEGMHNLRNIPGGFKAIRDTPNIPLVKEK